MGGAAEVAYQISRHLAARGHEITVVTTDYPLKADHYKPQNVHVVEIPNLLAVSGFYFSPGLIDWARRNIYNFDIIHMHTCRTFQNAVIRNFAIKHQVPYVLSAHGTLPIIVQRKWAKRIFDWVVGDGLLESASCLLAVSPVEAEQYQRAGIPDNKIKVIFNGLDLHEFDSLPPRGAFRKWLPGVGENTKIILYLGRIDRRKRIDQLINAFSCLCDDQVESVLVIAGPDGGDLKRLRSLICCLNLQSRVIFTGPLYGSDKLASYVDADVLVSSAIYEIFGLVPFEALMCGTPVIVTDEGGCGKLVQNAEAGYTVAVGDVNGLATMISHVLSHLEEAKKKVQAGQSFIRQNLDWKKLALQIENLYLDLAR
jgi:glycosyltransferase involved in cell wall biosynthesis